MTTITVSSTIGIKLTPASYTRPVIIGTGVTISNPGYPDGVYTAPDSTTSFAVQNNGTIVSADTTSSIGVYLAPGGSVTNATSAFITGLNAVKVSRSAGTVINSGSIEGGGRESIGVNGYRYFSAIYLTSGGLVTNAVGGSITGVGFQKAYSGPAVEIAGGAGTLVNDGSISGRSDLTFGGSMTNGVGAYDQGIKISGNSGTVVNYGSIYDNADVVYLDHGGSVTNAAGGRITGSTLGSGSFIVGIMGGYAGTVVNDGSIEGSTGVFLTGGGTVFNAGLIKSVAGTYSSGGSYVTAAAYGAIILGGIAGGSVTNTNTGTITGDSYGIQVSTGIGTLTNAGTIVGSNSYGVKLGGGGTLVNAGDIIGNDGTAVTFGGIGSNLLVLVPGFGFSGLVTGSGGASNTLELASAKSIGTVTGLGTQYLHFQSIALDSGAKWSLTGIQRGLAGTISGFAAGDTIVLTGVTATGSSYVGGILTLDETAGSATLDLPGTFSIASFKVTNGLDGAEVTDTGYRPAMAGAHTPEPVSLGTHRVGGVVDQALTISNRAPADHFSENLDASIGSPTTGITAFGSFTGLVPSASDTTDLMVGLDTSTAGAKSGTATITLFSDGTGVDGLGTTDIGTQTVNITGTVFAAATAELLHKTVDFGVVHSGAVVNPVTISVTNTATAALTDLLTAGTISETGSYTGTVEPLSSGLAAGASGSVTFGLNTTTAGTQSGTVDLGFFSHDTVLTDLALAAVPVTVTGTVDNFATATIKVLSGPTITGSPTAEVINLGTALQNSGTIAVTLDVLNSATGLADTLAGSFTVAGASSFTNTGFGSFSGLLAGATTGDDSVSLTTVNSGTFSESITLDPSSDNASSNTPQTAETLAVTGFVACFCAGTRILTGAGEVPVEELRVGDDVATLHGRRLAPIVWLGHRHLDCRRHPRPDDVWPVCVKAGAIADGVPHRDLWLSPEHAVLLRAGAEAVLVPIRHLLNRTTIAQAPRASVTYWHVELASHDAIVAEGLPAETYLDTGNRADFANGGPAVTVHPTFADAVWRARACAPQLRHGDVLGALQYRIAMRAARREHLQPANTTVGHKSSRMKTLKASG